MTTIFAFLIVLGVLIFVHELGHFMAARWAGAKVLTFSIGFGRAIFKWRDKKGTEWRIAWLPFGGYVSIYGQDDMFNRQKYVELSAKEKIGHYLSLPAWKQAVVIGAGVFMNMILAWVLYTGLFVGTKTVQLPVVGASETTELKKGDRIMQVNGAKVESWEEMLMAKELNAGYENNLMVLRGKKLAQVKMPSGKWGVTPDIKKTETTRNGIVRAAGRAGAELWRQSKFLFVVIGQIISGDRSAKQLGGIISIAETSGKAMADGFVAMVLIIALLSVNLGVINLFPLPITDGGMLLILGIEAVIRRKLQGRAMDWVMLAGWGLFILLILFTVWNDIARLVAK